MKSEHVLLTCYFRDRRRQGVVRHFRIFGWVELAKQSMPLTMEAFSMVAGFPKGSQAKGSQVSYSGSWRMHFVSIHSTCV